MKLTDLIQQLQNIADEVSDPDRVEVRLAEQPSWPFEYGVEEVILVNEYVYRNYADEDDCCEHDFANNPVVYIAQGGQIGYLPGAVSNALCWR